MGGLSSKRNTSANNSENVPNSWWSKSFSKRKLHIQSEQFYNELMRHLKSEDIENLSRLFSMLKRTIEQVSSYLNFWMMNTQFHSTYEKELQRYKYLRSDYIGDSCSELVKNHCLGVLIVHTKIFESINDFQKLKEILQRTAASHIFLKTSIKKHERDTFKFILNEFHNEINKETLKSLRKYFHYIGEWLQYLIDEKTKEKDTNLMEESMKHIREDVNNQLETFKSMRLIFFNDGQSAYSEAFVIEPKICSANKPIHISASEGFVIEPKKSCSTNKK